MSSVLNCMNRIGVRLRLPDELEIPDAAAVRRESGHALVLISRKSDGPDERTAIERIPEDRLERQRRELLAQQRELSILNGNSISGVDLIAVVIAGVVRQLIGGGKIRLDGFVGHGWIAVEVQYQALSAAASRRFEADLSGACPDAEAVLTNG